MKKTYWIIAEGVQQGPFTLDELRQRPDLTPQTPVWREGMADWTVAGLLPELNGGETCSAPESARHTYGPAYAAGPACGQGHAQGYPQESAPRNYLVWAIIATICCCVLTGIVAIIYASRVNPAVQSGDMATAREASEKAALWCVISFVAGLVWTPFYMLYSLVSM